VLGVVQVAYVSSDYALRNLASKQPFIEAVRSGRYLPWTGLYPDQSTFKKAHRVLEIHPNMLQIMGLLVQRGECLTLKEWSKKRGGCRRHEQRSDFYDWKKNKNRCWFAGWGKSSGKKNRGLLKGREKGGPVYSALNIISLLDARARHLPSMKIDEFKLKKINWLWKAMDYGKASQRKWWLVGSGAIGASLPTSIFLLVLSVTIRLNI